MTEAAPLVAVVIPAFNRERLLHEAVNSVLSQAYRPLQVVVVDDAPTDGTVAVIGVD
jgi:glycosyltransferase involved in cell wall biosynthesis